MAIGPTNITAAPYATTAGVIDNSGKLQGVSASNPMRIDPTGTTVQPVSGTTASPKTTVILTTTPLVGATNYTSPWIDTVATGDTFIKVMWYATYSGGSYNPVTVEVYETDDPNNANMYNPAGHWGGVAWVNGTGWLTAQIRSRYWQVVWTQNSVTGTALEISYTSMNIPPVVQAQGLYSDGSGAPLALSNLGDMMIAARVGAATEGSLTPRSWLDQTSSVSMALYMTPMVVSTAPSTNGGYMWAVRTPGVFKSVQAVSITAGTPQAIWTPASGKKFRLMGYSLSLSVAGSIILEDASGSANEIIRTPLMAAGVGMNAPQMGNGILSAAANNSLYADVTASGSISGFVYGTEE